MGRGGDAGGRVDITNSWTDDRGIGGGAEGDEEEDEDEDEGDEEVEEVEEVEEDEEGGGLRGAAGGEMESNEALMAGESEDLASDPPLRADRVKKVTRKGGVEVDDEDGSEIEAEEEGAVRTNPQRTANRMDKNRLIGGNGRLEADIWS